MKENLEKILTVINKQIENGQKSISDNNSFTMVLNDVVNIDKNPFFHSDVYNCTIEENKFRLKDIQSVIQENLKKEGFNNQVARELKEKFGWA